MATSYTSLLGFALPVTGELDGTWGDVVNNSITQLVEDSVAGAATQSVASGDWTLTTTGSGASNQARCAILIPTGSPGVSRNIIAPSSSKAYVVINQSNAAVVLKASATTGTTIASGTEAICAWNGSDFVTVATADIGNLSGTLGVAKGGTGNTTIPARSVFVANTLDTLTTVTPAAGQSIRVNAGNTAWEAYTPVTSAGDVSGPASSTDNAVARFDSTTGKIIQNSVVTIADTTGDMDGVGSITSTSASGILTRAAATQDGVEIKGRAGGTSSYKVTFTPTTLSANRTVTLPNADINFTTGLSVANGGTGATSLTGLIKGNGTSAFTAASAGTDYVAPGTATTFTAKQTFTGNGSNPAIELSNAIEDGTVSATAASGLINYDLFSQSVLYYTSNASSNWTVNIRADSDTTLSSIMDVGDSVTFAFLVTQGATAYYANAFQVDGSSVTPKWQGGTAPTSGNTNSIDVYVYTVIKTAATPTYTVFASQTKFA